MKLDKRSRRDTEMGAPRRENAALGEAQARWRSGMAAYNRSLPNGASPIRSVEEFQRLAKTRGWAVPLRTSGRLNPREKRFLREVLGIEEPLDSGPLPEDRFADQDPELVRMWGV